MCCRIAGGRYRTDRCVCKFRTRVCNILFVCLCLQLARGRRHVEGAEVGTQSCMDQSILAIFEDSTVASEVRVKADHHSEASLGAAQDCSL